MLPRRGSPRIFALALAGALGGCEAVFGAIPEDEPVETNPGPPPADALEARLRELGNDRAAFMVLEEAAMRGEITEGGARDFSRILHPGWCYKVLGVGGEGVRDLDLRVYDPGQALLQRDTTQDAEPYIGQMRPICPGESGAYRIEVRGAAGSGPFVVQLYRSI